MRGAEKKGSPASAGDACAVVISGRLLRISNRQNMGNRGTCRSWRECRCIHTAGGFDFVNQILPSIPHIFSVTDSMRALRILQRHRHPLQKPDSPFSQLDASGQEDFLVPLGLAGLLFFFFCLLFFVEFVPK